MEILPIDGSSPLLEAVISLGDQNCATLGFLPEQAFHDYAQKKHIIVALSEDQTLLGYLLFRISKDVTSIVHLCISNEHRGNGIAKSLMDYLFETTTHTYGIRLQCRRDYRLNSFWRSLGFTPLSEKPGRAKKTQTILTIWLRPHKHDTLFDYVENALQPKPFTAILDTNIVIDLFEGSHNESLQLQADYLQDIVTYKVADTIFHEINSQENTELRKTTMKFAKQFDIVNNSNLFEYGRIFDDIQNQLSKPISDNTLQDISHITHSILSGALAFITRDEIWIGSEISDYINNHYGLQILSPGEFILSIDEFSRQENYFPQQLVGLDLQYSKMTVADLKDITSDFQNSITSETLRQLHQQIRLLMSDPLRNNILTIKKNSHIIALFVYTQSHSDMEISLLRLSSNFLLPSLRSTLLRRIAMKLLEIAANSQIEFISMKNSLGIPEDVQDAFLCAGYQKSNSQIYKILLTQITNKISFIKDYAHICIRHKIDNSIEELPADLHLSPQHIVSIEKTCWPLKLNDVSIPTYIVPIKPHYAMELFDEKLSNSNISFFPNERIEPALSIENIYFKSAHQVPQNFPARILWYVSHDKNLMYDMCIRACSYLDSIETDSAKKIFNRYKRLGVLDWGNILSLAKGDPHNYISCYKFSFTELFSHPIPYITLKEWHQNSNRKTISLQSYTEIDNTSFISLYNYGKYGSFRK